MMNNFMNAPVNATEHKKVELRKETLEKLEHVVEMLKTENPGEDVWIGIYELLDAVFDEELVRGDHLWNDISRDLGAQYSVFWGPDELIAGWYFGFVEFVPKKEPRFIINVDSPTGIGRAEKDDNGNVRIEYYEFDVATRSFTEAEANELVAGLTALNARKVKVEE